MLDPSSSTNALVLRRVLDHARVAGVDGELGTAIARYLDAVERGPDEHAFAALADAHGAAIAANRNIQWCLRRVGGDDVVLALGRDLDACARWMADAHAALVAARRPPRTLRTLARWIRRAPAEPARTQCARECAYAAMAFSERVERLRERIG
jgi:hypothetical protein